MEHKVTIQPSGHSFVCRSGESLLTGALREGYGLPYGCRSGACGTCKGRIISGTVDYGAYQKTALSDEEKADGKALFCLAQPTSEIVIEARTVAGVRDIEIRKLPCRVETIERPNHDVAILHLRLPANETLRYLPGQYIDILLKDGRRRSFSIANAPGQGEMLTLHVRHYPGGEFSGYVVNEMKPRTLLRFEGPLGTFFLREDSDKPIVFMAGGTGFAPIKAIVEHALASGTLRPMVLYWGARTRADLYMADVAGQWQALSDRFTFIPVLSEPKPEDAWPGRTGFVHRAVLDDFADLSGYQVYSCGPPAMVESGKKAFVEQRGLPEEEFYSDPFTIAVDPNATPAA